MAGHGDESEPIDAADARGGEIILKKRRNRLIFFGALMALPVLALVLYSA